MKKVFPPLLFLLLPGLGSMAQKEIKLGLEAGISPSLGVLSTTEKQSKIFKQKIGYGYSWGLIASIPVSNHLEISPAIIWNITVLKFKIDPHTVNTSMVVGYSAGGWMLVLPIKQEYRIHQSDFFSGVGISLGRALPRFTDTTGFLSSDSSFLAVAAYSAVVKNSIYSFATMEEGIIINKHFGELYLSIGYSLGFNEKLSLDARYGFVKSKKFRSTITSANSFLFARVVFFPSFRKIIKD